MINLPIRPKCYNFLRCKDFSLGVFFWQNFNLNKSTPPPPPLNPHSTPPFFSGKKQMLSQKNKDDPHPHPPVIMTDFYKLSVSS